MASFAPVLGAVGNLLRSVSPRGENIQFGAQPHRGRGGLADSLLDAENLLEDSGHDFLAIPTKVDGYRVNHFILIVGQEK